MCREKTSMKIRTFISGWSPSRLQLSISLLWDACRLPTSQLSEGWTHTLHTLTPPPAHFFPGAQWLFVNRLNVHVQLSLPFISEPERRNRHGLNCVLPKIQTLKPPPPGCQNVTVFGHGALKRPLRVDLNPVWTVSLYEEEIRTQPTHQLRGQPCEDKWEANCLQAKERGLRRNQTC